ncbi:MAG: MFS transporter [Candidatus Saganbacteria bacterium]|nr:MFS transporter [Candidatus Saganbacteria bacterium]
MANNKAAQDIWERLPQAFHALRFKNYRIFWIGQFVSLVGLWMMMIAQGWLAYDITNSKFLLGLVDFIAGIPVLLLSPLGGFMADRMDRRKLLLATQIVFAIASFLIGLLISTGQINYFNLCLLALVFGLANAVDSPVRQAFVVNLVERNHFSNAIALNSLSFNSARVIGPAVAGYLIGAFGVGLCFYLNAVSFLAVIVSLLMIKGIFKVKTMQKANFGEAFMDSVKYVLQNRKVLLSLVLMAFTSLFIMPYAVLMPVFAKDILNVGAQGLGVLMSFSGVGALLGAFFLAQFGAKKDFTRTIIVSTTMMALAAVLFSFSRNYLLSCAALLILGFNIVTQAISVNTFLQYTVTDELRGRIMGFYSMSFMGLMPIGAFQAGALAHFIGAPHTLLIGAVISFLPALFLFFRRATAVR